MNALILCDENVYDESRRFGKRDLTRLIPHMVSLLEGAGFTSIAIAATPQEAIEAVRRQSVLLAIIEWEFYYDNSELPELLKDTPIFFISPGPDFFTTENHFTSPSAFIGWYTQPLEFCAYVRRLLEFADKLREELQVFRAG